MYSFDEIKNVDPEIAEAIKAEEKPRIGKFEVEETDQKELNKPIYLISKNKGNDLIKSLNLIKNNK